MTGARTRFRARRRKATSVQALRYATFPCLQTASLWAPEGHAGSRLVSPANLPRSLALRPVCGRRAHPGRPHRCHRHPRIASHDGWTSCSSPSSPMRRQACDGASATPGTAAFLATGREEGLTGHAVRSAAVRDGPIAPSSLCSSRLTTVKFVQKITQVQWKQYELKQSSMSEWFQSPVEPRKDNRHSPSRNPGRTPTHQAGMGGRSFRSRGHHDAP